MVIDHEKQGVAVERDVYLATRRALVTMQVIMYKCEVTRMQKPREHLEPMSEEDVGCRAIKSPKFYVKQLRNVVCSVL